MSRRTRSSFLDSEFVILSSSASKRYTRSSSRFRLLDEGNGCGMALLELATGKFIIDEVGSKVLKRYRYAR